MQDVLTELKCRGTTWLVAGTTGPS